MHTIYDNPLPSGWLEEPLGTLVETKRGCTWTKEQERDRPAEGTIPVIRIPNIKSSLDLKDLLHIYGLSADQRTSSAVTKGWTLMVGSNGNPKRIGDSVLMEEDREMIFASFLFALRPKLGETKISDEFVACWLHGHRIHEFVSETSQMTTGLANISWSACRKLPVRFPKHNEEQTRIAETLKAADDHIRALELQIRTAERVKKSLLQAFPPSPKHGMGIQLSRVADISSGFTMGRDLAGHDTIEVGYLTVVNVLEGRVDFSNLSTAEVKLNEIERYGLREGDILMTEGGDRDKVGRGSIWLGQVPRVVCQNHIFRVRLSIDKVLPWFMHYLLQTYSAKRYFFGRAKQSNNLCTINSREMRQFELPTLTTKEQEPWVDRLRAADEVIAAIESQLTAALRVKQSLLQNLLTGRIRLKG
ncbi:restriction endonuclease subunit S [Cyanobium sp. NS01]|uniref:restriction endonuclease subunit S n=1 Tax=Cyanobium sp. NS01 TaxID=261284 RepID=UPI0016449AB1|nr:restriction endonuclease subunit S [Cyanobium sp. NS01]QNI70896.1 Putative Type I restriction-modification system S subunit [Cyanobium sp. NS01]